MPTGDVGDAPSLARRTLRRGCYHHGYAGPTRAKRPFFGTDAVSRRAVSRNTQCTELFAPH